MSIVELLEGAGSYTSLAEVTTAESQIDAPESIGPEIIVAASASLVLTFYFDC